MATFTLAIIIAIIIVVIVAIASIVGFLNKKWKASNLKNYLKKNFPNLPEDIPVFEAKQKNNMETDVNDISLMIDDENKQLILLLKEKKLDHRVYPFNDLIAIKTSEEKEDITESGFWYIRNMVLEFSDNSKYNFLLRALDDNDAGKFIKSVKDKFAPWEEKLNVITKK